MVGATGADAAGAETAGDGAAGNVATGAGATGAGATGADAAGAGATGADATEAGAAGCGAGADGRGPGRGALLEPLPPGNASRSRRATGASTVEDADFTNSPCSLSLASTVLLSMPSSLASS